MQTNVHTFFHELLYKKSVPSRDHLVEVAARSSGRTGRPGGKNLLPALPGPHPVQPRIKAKSGARILDEIEPLSLEKTGDGGAGGS